MAESTASISSGSSSIPYNRRKIVVSLLLISGLAWALTILASDHMMHVSRTQFGIRPASPWIFISGYLITWAGFGLLVFALGSLVGALSGIELLDGDWPAWWVGAALILAGIYQLTPLEKRLPVPLPRPTNPSHAHLAGWLHRCGWDSIMEPPALAAAGAWMGLTATVIGVDRDNLAVAETNHAQDS